jgi:thiol-disulfide isomerase/thioredoxin
VLERTFLELPAPTLDGLASLSGEAAPSWSSLRGRIVVLDFWAPWCGVCHLISPELNRWQTRFGERLAVIGIAPGSVAQITQAAPHFHMQYQVFADPEERVIKAFDAFAVPLILVVDGAGVVRAISLGYSSQQLNKMERLVEKLLAPS